MKAIQLGYDYAKQNFSCPLPLRVEKMDATAGTSSSTATPPPRSAACTPARPSGLVSDHAVDLA